MQNKAAIKRYFNQEKPDGPPDKKQKFQKKQKQGGGPKSPGASEKAKFHGPKEKTMKRKPEETAKQNGGGPPKKIPFPGTAQLHVKKAEKKPKNEGLSPAKVPSIKTSSPEPTMNRAKQRRLKNQIKRRTSKQNFSSVVESMQKGDEASIEKIKEKIANIQSRDTLSNTARKKLRKLQSLLKLVGIAPEGTVDVKRAIKPEKNIEAKKPKKILVKKPIKEEVKNEDSEDEDSSEQDIKPDIALNKEESEEEESDREEVDGSKAEFLPLEEEESSDEEASDEENESEDAENDDDEKEEEDDDDEEEDEDSDDEEEKSDEPEESPKEVVKIQQKQKNKQNDSPSKDTKSRYVVFVGNLPYNIEKAQIMQHFKKVGDIQDIRLAMDPNTKKSRGFAYVELKNEESYQKALGLNHTFIAGRKINVEYTKGGKKKGEDAKKEIKAKNMKLREMRKQGKFGGAKNATQKRAERRIKQKGSK